MVDLSARRAGECVVQPYTQRFYAGDDASYLFLPRLASGVCGEPSLPSLPEVSE